MPPIGRNMVGQEKLNIYNRSTFQHRQRILTADINAGAVQLLNPPAPRGFKYAVTDMAMIAIGGAATGATSINITGIRAGAAVQLMAAAVAGLTQSTYLRAGAANAAILPDGASFDFLDVDTGITVTKVGGTLATATNIDVIITYTLHIA